MEYERALYRVYERVIDDLNTTPSPFVSDNAANAASASEQQPDHHQFLPFCCPLLEIHGWNFLQRLYSGCRTMAASHRGGCLPLFYSNMDGEVAAEQSLLHSNSSSTSGSESAVEINSSSNGEGENVTNHITSSASIAHRFRQRAISRLHSMTGGGRRRGARARQRRQTGEQHQQQTDTAESDPSDLENRDEVDVMENNENSPLRPITTNTNFDSSNQSSDVDNDDAGSVSIEQGRRNISFGGNINTNPFAAHPPRDSEHNTAQEVSACSQKFLYLVMNLAMYIGLAHLVVLWTLHSTYVRPDVNGGFLGVWHPSYASQQSTYFYTIRPPDRPQSLSMSALEVSTVELKGDGVSSAVNYTKSADDNDAIRFYNGPTCIEYALSTRPIRFYYNTTKSNATTSAAVSHTSSSSNPNPSDGSSSNTTITSSNHTSQEYPPEQIEEGNWTALELLGKDELLYINILYGGKCPTNAQCSRTHTVTHSTPYDDVNSNETEEDTFLSSRDWTNAKYWEKPMYKFSTMEALIHVDDEFLWRHNVSIVNITVTEGCLSSGADGIK